MLRFNQPQYPFTPQRSACYTNLAFFLVKPKNVKLKFTPEEDDRLRWLVQQHGTNSWNLIAKLMGNRNARQCRERWKNYVNPELRNEPWNQEEDRLLVEKYGEFGPRWNKIAKFFVNRSDNSLRNRWQLMLRQYERQQENQAIHFDDTGRDTAHITAIPPALGEADEKEKGQAPALMTDVQNLLNIKPVK